MALPKYIILHYLLAKPSVDLLKKHRIELEDTVVAEVVVYLYGIPTSYPRTMNDS